MALHRNGRKKFIQEQRREELVSLTSDTAQARAECANLLPPSVQAELAAQFVALDGAGPHERHDFWSTAAACAAVYSRTGDALIELVRGTFRWFNAIEAVDEASGICGAESLRELGDAEEALKERVARLMGRFSNLEQFTTYLETDDNPQKIEQKTIVIPAQWIDEPIAF
jgi:hypothetical protein